MRKAIYVILSISILFSCRSAKQEVEKIFEDGVEVIVNHVVPYEFEGDPSKLILEEQFVIDLEDENYGRLGITAPRVFDVDTEGNIYLMQQRTSERFIFKFDDEGNLLASLGNQGQGPGEIQFPTSFTINAKNELVLMDWGARKLIFLDSEGGFIKEIKLRTRILGVFPLHNGKYLIYKSLDTPEAAEAQVLAFVLCDSDLNEIKEIYRVIDPHLDKLEKIDAIGEQVLVQTSSNRIYAGSTKDGYEVLTYDLEGALVRKIRKDYVPVPVTEDIKKLYGVRWERVPAEIREKVFFPKYLPPFQGSFIDDEGRLFIMTFEKEPNSDRYVYDIFNPEGMFINRIALDNFGERGVSVGPLLVMAKGERIYHFRGKESGYNELVVYKMIWE